MADKLSPDQRRKCMSHIRSANTGIEMSLRKALWNKGYRYRKNYESLPGKPDIVFTKQKVAIFCDSEFFHGKDWDGSLHAQILRGSNPQFWEKKITRNIQRDQEVNQQLLQMGWTVLRFWEVDIKKNLSSCVAMIEEALTASKNSRL